MGILCLDQIKFSINGTDLTLLRHQNNKTVWYKGYFHAKKLLFFWILSKEGRGAKRIQHENVAQVWVTESEFCLGFTLASSRQRLSCRITHCKTDKKFFWKSELKHFFLVLSYEIYYPANSYSTKHASQEGSLTGRSQETPCTDRN